MYDVRGLVAYAHVRPSAVVETDVPAYGAAGLPYVAEGAAAKQAAGGRDAYATTPNQFRHCLAPSGMLFSFSGSC